MGGRVGIYRRYRLTCDFCTDIYLLRLDIFNVPLCLRKNIIFRFDGEFFAICFYQYCHGYGAYSRCGRAFAAYFLRRDSDAIGDGGVWADYVVLYP